MEGQQEAKEKRGCLAKHSRGFGVGQEEEKCRGPGKAGKRQVGCGGEGRRRAYLQKIPSDNLCFLYELEGKTLLRP